MSLVRPVAYTDIHEEELQEERPVSEETVRKIIHNVNMLRALLPIGLVKAYNINRPAVKVPSTRLYQYCDGGEISEPTSPLNGAGPQNVPNMQAQYLRGGFSSDTAGTESGGSPTINLGHSHGTNVVDHGFNRLEAGDERRAFEPFHSHGISSDLTSDRALDLAHMQIAFYLKINL